MAVSSGRKRIKVMEQSREFFDIGEPFWYTPLSDENVHILVEPIPCTNVKDYGVDWFSQQECNEYCALSKWCAERGNYDSNGRNYIPSCSSDEREDETHVFFKEIG